jgi:8-oxo-dGTP pyrophosphatase MutT (NUDIX family)
MRANPKKAGGSRLTVISLPARTNNPARQFVRLARLHRIRECEQVAAVCYRVRDDEIEFLLVRTRGSGRWTFPKGSTEPGLTHAQAAALEAFEEAGVHGRIEEASFARYICRKRREARKSSARSEERTLAVNAHLCQVLRLGKPKESNRDRTWFSVNDAKQCLREERDSCDGAQFARVVDKAAARIQRLLGGSTSKVDHWQQDRQTDALQRVQFEAVAEFYGSGQRGSSVPSIRTRLKEMRRSSVPAVNSQGQNLLQGALLPFSSTQEPDKSAKWFPAKKIKALGTGTSSR